MMKVVLQLGLYDDKDKKKAMKVASSLQGVESISIDMKDKKMTVTGVADPIGMVSKLRKLCQTEVLSVGLAKEPEKKEEEPKKQEEKKTEVYHYIQQPNNYPHYYHHYPSNIYVNGPEESPNTCVIC